MLALYLVSSLNNLKQYMDVGPDEDRTADQTGSSKQLQIGLLNSHEQPQMRTSSYRLQTAPTGSFTTAYTAQGTA